MNYPVPTWLLFTEQFLKLMNRRSRITLTQAASNKIFSTVVNSYTITKQVSALVNHRVLQFIIWTKPPRKAPPQLIQVLLPSAYLAPPLLGHSILHCRECPRHSQLFQNLNCKWKNHFSLMTYFQLLLQHFFSAQAAPLAALDQVRKTDVDRHFVIPCNHELSSPWMESNSFSQFHSLRWPHPESLVTQGDHRKLHCKRVFHFLSHSFQPAPQVHQDKPLGGIRTPSQKITQGSCRQASAPSQERPSVLPRQRELGAKSLRSTWKQWQQLRILPNRPASMSPTQTTPSY